MGSPVNMAAYVQLDAAIPNYFLQEAYPAADRLNEILEEPLVRDGGYVVVPDRPGIGIEIREEKLAKFPFRPYTHARLVPRGRLGRALDEIQCPRLSTENHDGHVHVQQHVSRMCTVDTVKSML